MAQSEKIKYSVVEGWEQLPKGDIYITDGYGNARVHKFSFA